MQDILSRDNELPCAADEPKAAAAGGRKFALEKAFQRFSQASAKLEAKYEFLRREAEELRARLREKEAEIARSARLAMLGETAAAIAHEVRNPLGSIKLFASLLKQDLSDRPESLKLVEEINKSLTNLDNVVSNILHFSKKQSLQLAPVNIHAVIQQQISALAASTPKNPKIKLSLEASPFIQANEHSLRQVFYNFWGPIQYRPPQTVDQTGND